MNWFSPMLRIWFRMTFYGLILGGLAGGLVLQIVEVTTGNYGGDLSPFWFCFSFIFGAIGVQFLELYQDWLVFFYDGYH